MKSIFIHIALFIGTHIFSQNINDASYVKMMNIHQGASVGVFGNLLNQDCTLYNDGHITMIGDSIINTSPIIGQGTLEMLGVFDQHISDKGKILIDSLILNNVLDVSFDNNIFVAKHVAFINGVLYDNYDATYHPDNLPAVHFEEGADYDTSLVRDLSHIEGLVRKEGRTRFIFPIGDAGFFRPVTADNIKSDTVISAHYYYEWITYPESRLQIGLEIFKDEYWYVSGSEGLYDLSLSYDPVTSTFDTSLDSIKITSYNDRFDKRYRLIDAEPQSILSKLNYEAQPHQMDSNYVWYGFARLDPAKTPQPDFFIPQIITPNGDGSNDKFIIKGLTKHPINRLLIFNRYGNVVYEKEQYDNSWEGVANKSVVGGSNNHELPSGTYYVFFYSNEKLIYKDFVQIVRTE